MMLLTYYKMVITQISQLRRKHLGCLLRQYIKGFKEELQRACNYFPTKL